MSRVNFFLKPARFQALLDGPPRILVVLQATGDELTNLAASDRGVVSMHAPKRVHVPLLNRLIPLARSLPSVFLPPSLLLFMLLVIRHRERGCSSKQQIIEEFWNEAQGVSNKSRRTPLSIGSFQSYKTETGISSFLWIDSFAKQNFEYVKEPNKILSRYISLHTSQNISEKDFIIYCNARKEVWRWDIARKLC